MGYFGIGSEPMREAVRGGGWKDSTNNAVKHHVVRLAIGTSDEFEYLHTQQDLPFGVLQTAGTYNNMVDVATEGIVICVNSLAGTIARGDPVCYDHANCGGTVGKVMSAWVGATDGMLMAGTNWTPGTALRVRAQPITHPIRPGSVRFGTAMHHIILPEGGSGTALLADVVNTPMADVMYYQMDYPVIGFALDQANSPNDELRVKLARQHDIKANSVW